MARMVNSWRQQLGVATLVMVWLLVAQIVWGAPTLTEKTPVDGATAVGLDAAVTATFSAAMNPATITTGSFSLSRFVGIQAVAAGGDHTVALKKDGTVIVWGDNRDGQTSVPAGLSGVTAVAAGVYHSVALQGDGTVVAWGDNYYGQSTVPAGLGRVAAIAAGAYHTVALQEDGTVVAWGQSDYDGEMLVPSGLSGVIAIAAGAYHTVALQGDGTVTVKGYYGPMDVPAGLSGVTAIAAGFSHTVALKQDGTVVAWGDNYNGQTTVPPGLSGVSAIAAGAYHTVALKSDGTVVAWGGDYGGATDVPAGLSGVIAIAAGGYHTVALQGDGTIAAWGDDYDGQSTAVPARLSGVTDIAAGTFHTVVLQGDGTAVSWGINDYGQTTVPAGLNGVTAIAAGGDHTLALLEGGTVVAWGNGPGGEKGVPVGLNGVSAIAAGGNHSVVLKSDGTVVAWGDDYFGQSTVPAGLSGVTAIAAGDNHTVALKGDGTVVAWGWNGAGQTDVPAGLSGVTAIAAGYGHSVALKSDGTVVAWGYNDHGQTDVPAGLSGVASIAAGGGHTVALQGDGAVVAWGSDVDGQTTVPPGLGRVIAIAAGGFHTVALQADGSVVAWGDNYYGQTTVPTSPYDAYTTGNVTYDPATLTAIFTPASPLDYATTYTARLNTGVRSLAGAPLAAESVWTFTTSDPPSYAVTFDLAGGTRIGGGALSQLVVHGQGAVAPTVTAPASTVLSGWSTAFDVVTAPITVTAQYATDSDSDGISDADEVLAGTDPLNPDTLPPGLILSMLGHQARTNNPSLNVSGIVTDNQALASLTVNGAAVTVAENGTFSTVVGLLAGNNIVTIVATDLAGNKTQKSRTIVLDQQAPEIALETPADNSYTPYSIVMLSGTVDETATVEIVDQLGVTHVPLRAGNDFSIDLLLTAGLNTLTVNAVDLAANAASAKRTIIYDPLSPSLAVTSPAEDIIVRDGMVTIAGQVSDTYDDIDLVVFCDLRVFIPAIDTNGAFTQQIVLAQEGTYPVQVTATDAAGNITSVTRNILYTRGQIAINQGAEVTGTPIVTLGLDYYPSAVKMRLWNNNTWSAWMPFAATRTVTLPSGDGLKRISVQFLADDQQESEVYTDTILLDTTPPSGSISIANGAAVTTALSTTLTLTLAESGAGAQMQFSRDKLRWSEWEPFAASKAWTFAGSAGVKTVHARFRDRAGKVSAIVSDSILYRLTALPAGSSGGIAINTNAPYATAVTVALQLTSPAQSYTQMALSNNGSTWSAWETVKSGRSWTLAAGDGVKPVYVRFRTAAGAVSTLYSDTIVLDTKPPTGSVVIAGGAAVTSSDSVNLTLNAADFNGVTQMQFSADKIFWSNWGDFATSIGYRLGGNDGPKPIYVRFKDSAGKISAIVSDTITLDRTAPQGTVKINGGSATLTGLQATLAFDAPGAHLMTLSVDDGSSWGAWEPYVTSKRVTLPAGDGSKTVRVQFRDLAGNVSAPATATATLTTALAPATLTVPPSDADGGYPVAWSSVGSGYTYTLEEAKTPDFTTGKRTVYTGTALKAAIAGRTKGSTYYYRVKTSKSTLAPSVWTVAANGCHVGL